MYGEGIYAGVCKGSALPISNKINCSLFLNTHQSASSANNFNSTTNSNYNKNSSNSYSNNTHHTHYPATSVHNITTRGRNVLAIAQQQEDAQQQTRLLRSALCTNSPITNNNEDKNDVIDKKK